LFVFSLTFLLSFPFSFFRIFFLLSSKIFLSFPTLFYGLLMFCSCFSLFLFHIICNCCSLIILVKLVSYIFFLTFAETIYFFSFSVSLFVFFCRQILFSWSNFRSSRTFSLAAFLSSNCLAFSKTGYHLMHLLYFLFFFLSFAVFFGQLLSFFRYGLKHVKPDR
jgi:hypothetical protein